MSVLAALIETGENISLSENDIMQICFNQTKIISYSALLKVKDILDLLDEFNNFILFYETDSKSIGHWVCVIFHRERHTIELFDSYGLNDEQLLENSDTSELLVDGKPVLTYLINQAQKTYGMKYIYNNIQLQSAEFGAVNTCGRYAALRARFCYMSLEKFRLMLKSPNNTSDFIVTALTIMFNENIDEIITEMVENDSRQYINRNYKLNTFKKINLKKV